VPPAIRNPKDFWSGVLFLFIGLATIVIARTYTMGSATRMGPAYFPSVLGGILALIGVTAIIRAFIRPGEPIHGFALKKVGLVVGATVLFGLLMRGAGLIIAVAVLVIVSAYGSASFRWKPMIALAVGMAVFSALVFIKALGVPIPLFGSWFGA
jgi:hypothetical protein